MLSTSVLAVICMVLVTINAEDERGTKKACSNHPEGYCINYVYDLLKLDETCPTSSLYSYSGCGLMGKCCYPKAPTPKPTTATDSKGKQCTYDPTGYCINYTNAECPYGYSSSYAGCGVHGKCCIPRDTRPRPTSGSISSSGTKKSCRNHPDGVCVDESLQDCPSSYSFSYSGCGWREKCCYPRPTPPTTTIRPNVSHTGDIVGGSGQSCGNPSVNPYVKIVGGQTTTIETYPWQVLIRKNGRHHCGGSLINERWVLTAAHCIRGHTSAKLDVAVGITDKYHYYRSQVIPVAGHLVHHGYTGSNNDIALMKLAKPVDLRSKKMRAICLPQATDNFDSENCIVSGWGATSEKGYSSDLLRDLTVPIISRKLCSFYMYVRPGVMCAGHVKGGKDACQGDSGGPLVCKGDNGNWIQAGVVSTGIGCARANKLGLYTEVAAFRDWIDNIVNQNS